VPQLDIRRQVDTAGTAHSGDLEAFWDRAALRVVAPRNAGIAVAMRQMTERGWQADLCLVRPDDTAAPAVERQLADKHYDGVVIGGGIRLPPKSLLLFEAVINAVHRAAPGAFIAFNTRPEDSADAAARWLKGD
jgi:hypothetical protein